MSEPERRGRSDRAEADERRRARLQRLQEQAHAHSHQRMMESARQGLLRWSPSPSGVQRCARAFDQARKTAPTQPDLRPAVANAVLGWALLLVGGPAAHAGLIQIPSALVWVLGLVAAVTFSLALRARLEARRIWQRDHGDYMIGTGIIHHGQDPTDDSDRSLAIRATTRALDQLAGHVEGLHVFHGVVLQEPHGLLDIEEEKTEADRSIVVDHVLAYGDHMMVLHSQLTPFGSYRVMQIADRDFPELADSQYVRLQQHLNAPRTTGTRPDTLEPAPMMSWDLMIPEVMYRLFSLGSGDSIVVIHGEGSVPAGGRPLVTLTEEDPIFTVGLVDATGLLEGPVCEMVQDNQANPAATRSVLLRRLEEMTP